jgi:hypothetical protein
MLNDAIPLENGRVTIGLRGETYHARVWVSGLGRYAARTLKTRDLEEAKKLARRYLWEIEERQKHGLPVASKAFAEVIDEYVAKRRLDHLRAATSRGMLRQIERIAKFWREFVGRRSVSDVGDRELKEYIDWRRNYYSRKGSLPRNAKLYPTDASLQFEIMVGKAVLSWSTDRGYRGTLPKPSFSFTAKKKGAFGPRSAKKTSLNLVPPFSTPQ